MKNLFSAPSITNLTPYRDGGWMWNVTTESEVSDEMVTREYNTNPEGEGLWCDGKQVLGTCQFSLNVADVRGKIRRHFTH
jgi:hypothetical protein